MTRTIEIDKVRDVAEFVAAANKVNGAVYARRGEKISVDAKSLMGMFALDPSQPFMIEYPADATELDAFITPFEIKA